MNLDKPIVDYIQRNAGKDLGELTADVRRRFNILLSIQTVRNVLQTSERVTKIEQARTQAASSVSDKVGIQENAIEELKTLAFDTPLDVKDRLAVLKELRQWVGQSIEVSGLYDEKTNAVFMLEWDEEDAGAALTD